MNLIPIDTVDSILPADFKTHYYDHHKPVIIKQIARKWPAFEKWNFEFLKQKVGNLKVGVYNNIKSDARTSVNKPDGEMWFADYLNLLQQGPLELRIFLFNILSHCPEMINDFDYPEEFMGGYLKKYPMLFTGGEGSITHMHYDMDLSNIFHTQFLGRKRTLLFGYEEGKKLYHLPFTVQSLVNFEKYYDALDVLQYPALSRLEGYECILERGDTLFMPAGCWHHMEYLESGLSLSLRAFDHSIALKLRGLYNLFGMRNIDLIMKKAAPDTWYRYKRKKAFSNADKVLQA